MSLLPLESNPDVMNKFLQKLGVSADKWNVVDVFGLDPESLAWVPKPVASIILLFPLSDEYKNFSQKQCTEITEKGQVVVPDLYYMKQLVSNACGTVALLHSIANNVEQMGVTDGPFKNLLDESRNMSPEERGELMQKSAEQILQAHQELAMEGQTEANPNEQVNYHFVAFVHKGGYLYELDGRKDFPVNHGTTSGESLLEDAAQVCKQYIDRDPNQVNFTVMALCAKEN